MKIIEPKVELWEQGNTDQSAIEHVCKCAQISYGSNPKKGEDAVKFYEGLIKAKHYSCLRHRSYYFKIPHKDYIEEKFENWYSDNPYIEIIKKDNFLYVATNGQFIFERDVFYRVFGEFEVTPEEFYKYCPELMRYTFCITTQISTSRELLRHSPQNVTESSTRYIKDNESIVRPYWLDANIVQEYPSGSFRVLDSEGKELTDLEKLKVLDYIQSCELSFNTYNRLLKHGMKPENARGVLPLDTMTNIVMTNSVNDWKKIIDMRVYDSTGRAHPNIKYVIKLVENKLKELNYNA